MLRSSLIAASAVLLCGITTAQQTPQSSLKPTKIPAGTPIKNAGTYHLSTGTWTRGTGGTANIGNDTIYNNDSTVGYFTGFLNGDLGIDDGEIPATNHPTHGAGTDRNKYVVNGFTFGYCADVVSAALGVQMSFYELYSPCGDPATLGINPEKSLDLSGIIPGDPTFGCWIVTFDLMNTTAEFKLLPSGDGSHDASTPIDGFGWSIEFGGSGGSSGPILGGDPNYYAFGAGCYYTTQGPIPSSNTGSGLGNQDLFFGQGPGFLPTYTCYWFGGYKNTIGPNAASRPHGGFWLTLYSDENNVHDFLRYCTGDRENNTSTGAPTTMRLETQDGSGALIGFDRSVAGNGSPNRLMMIAQGAPGPGNGGATNIGYFLMGTGQNTFTPPGSVGPLCIAPGLKRYLPPVNKTSESITFHHPVTGAPTTLNGQGFSRAALGAGAHPIGSNIVGGSRWNFQAWHRDGMNPSNLSDAVSVDFVP